MTTTKPLKARRPRWKSLAHRFLPSLIREHLRELRELSGAARRAHVRSSFRRLFGTADAVPTTVRASDVILFVCHGNIIRSALAAELTRHHAAAMGLQHDRVLSAGVFAKPGREADARAVAAGATLGVDLSTHRAQPLTAPLIESAAVVYVMDRLNEAQVLARFPEAASKLRRLGALATDEHGDVIADPYVLDAAAVAAVAERIDRATRAMVQEIARRHARADLAKST
jgi:protein-tyrosine-phosphatase